jgi:pyruvate dehydrogenase E2 component (dihydrolipoamide acetyltransferase)
MPTDFTLPELGENIAGGDVVRVLVAAGDSVKKDQPVLELETDKATIEVPSSLSGTVREVKIKQGERVKVGQVILTLDNGAAPGKDTGKDVAGEKPKPQPVGAAEEGGLSQEMPGAATAQPVPAPAPAPSPEPKPKRGEVVDIRGGTARASGPGRTVRAPSRTRTRRRHPPRRRQRAGWPHQPRRCAGVRAERLGRRDPR